MSPSRTRRLFEKATSVVSRLVTTSGNSVETLEPRQLLSGDVLPAIAEWSQWGGAPVAAVRGSYIVTFDDQMSNDNAVLAARDVASALGIRAWDVKSIARGQYAMFSTDSRLTLEQAQAVSEIVPGVRWVEPNQVFKSQRVPNDPLYGNQYWLNNNGQTLVGVPQGTDPGTAGADVRAESVWDITIGSRNVIVGIIDTGVDIDHPDLRNNIWTNPGEIAGDGIDNDNNGYTDDVNGFDFGEFDNNPRDTEGHGTAVAGMVGAVGNNGIGVSGINWLVSLLPLKIADASGALRTDAIIQAHDYATLMRQRGFAVDVTSNSYGSFAPDFYTDDNPNGIVGEQAAIDRYIAAGGIFVASAGNGRAGGDNIGDNNDVIPQYPASYPNPGILTIAATDNDDALATFSNFGVQTVDLAAPGVNTYTTQVGGGYQYIDGTSFSGPLVAGIAALIKSVKPTASAVEVREILFNTSDPLPTLQGKIASGGRVNALRAVQAALSDGPVVQAVNPGPVTTQLDPNTGLPITSFTVSFSETVDNDPAFFNSSAVQLRADGTDNTFGTIDDVTIPVTSVVRSMTNPRQATINLNLGSFGGRLPLDTLQLTLLATGFRDSTGNRLNGNTSSGTNDVRTIRVVNTGGDNEGNDTTALATTVNFNASGEATFAGVFVGNGSQGALDVDLYRFDLPRGGQITAEVVAKRLPGGSTLDSVLRLFDASGTQIAVNDQFFGQDSFIDFYVRTAGTYYIGVSGFGNSTYTATNLSGRTGPQSQGAYTLKVGTQLARNDIVDYTGAGNAVAGQPAFPINIPRGGEPNPPSSTATQGTSSVGISILDTREVLDVNVSINIQHTNVSDLEISLIGPDNTTVLLFNRRGGNNADLGTRNGSGTVLTYTTFDDESVGSPIASAAAPFSGSFAPEVGNGLSAFDGKRLSGTWTLLVRDQRATANGRIIDWRMNIEYRNDTFGTNESNDTINTATNLTQVNGTGSETRDAFIGDGAFGGLDRDAFGFNADAGATINITAQPTQAVSQGGNPIAGTAVLNTALRLFDSQGIEIALSNLDNTLNSSILNYVVPNAGRYFIVVSESSNVAYSVLQPSTGTAASTTGNYRLTVNVAAGVSDGRTTLDGDLVDVSVTSTGTLGGESASPRLRYSNVEFLGTSGVNSFLGATAGGIGFVNSDDQSQLPFSVTSESDMVNNRAKTNGSYRGLKVERTLSYAKSDGFIAIDVFLTNTTATTLTGVSWMEGFNPDPALSLNEGTGSTANDRSADGRVVQARYTNNVFQAGLFGAMAISPSSAGAGRALILPANFTVRDSGQLLTLAAADPDGASSDSQLAVSFDVGDLTAGTSRVLRYFVFFATSQGQLDGLVAQVNNNTGSGFLTGSTGIVSKETLSTGQQVSNYPYRLYYPEGFNGANIFSFIPLTNPNNQPVRVVVIQRFEGVVNAANRDRVASFEYRDTDNDGSLERVLDVEIGALARRGVDINRPETFAAGVYPDADQTLIPSDQRNRAYSLEIRSTLPVAATFSYYDLAQIASGPVAVGESFTPITSREWSFANVQKSDPGVQSGAAVINSYVLLQNPSNTLIRAEVRLFNTDNNRVYRVIRDVPAFGRSGVYMSEFQLADDLTDTPEIFASIPNGVYGVTVVADGPLVAAQSTYDPSKRQATGTIGADNLGTTAGILPEGQFGQRNTTESVGILNSTSTATTVALTFSFQNGSSVRQEVQVPANSHRTFNVSSIPNFPTAQPYGIRYSSATPVSVNLNSPVSASGSNFSDAFSVTDSSKAYTYWGFGEGFRPGDNVDFNGSLPGVQRHPGLTETLRLYNPQATPVVVEITFNFDAVGGAGSETYRRTLPARLVTELNIDQFIQGNRRATNQSFGIFIKAPQPIVASMNHIDLLFPGGFATLGTPLGIVSQLT
jgi:subtilisin family serine protease/subtilisin-like proprotein convertase family protein